MTQPHQPPRLRPLAPLQQEEGAALRLIGKVSRQRWLTVGAIVLLGGAGLLLADSVAEVLVGSLQQDDADEEAVYGTHQVQCTARDCGQPGSTIHLYTLVRMCDTRVERFESEMQLRSFLTRLNGNYGTYAEGLWAAQYTTPEQLASASVQALNAAGVTVLSHVEDIKARAVAEARRRSLQDLATILQLCKLQAQTGGESLRARLQRPRGSEATAVTEDEVLYIISSNVKGPVECVRALEHNGVYGIQSNRFAAILTSLAHQAHGGVVLVGVDSSTRPATVTGCQSHTMDAVNGVLKSHIQPRLPVAVTTFSIDSKDVIAIDVGPARQPVAVVMADQRQLYYQRFGSATVRLAPQEAVAFCSVSGGRYSSDSAAVPGADLKFSSRHRCHELGLLADADCSTLDHEMALRSCSLLDPLTQNLTRAGLLLTGVGGFQSRLPQTFNFVIQAFYSSQGSCLKNIQGLRQQFDDSKRFDGPILQQIQDTAAWIQRMQATPYSKRLEAAAADSSSNQYVGCEHRQYATEALYEVLVNAACHRDYDKEGQAIQVWMFERALEVVVPGTVMPDAGDLNNQPKSDLRNLSIAMLLTRSTHPETRRRYFEGIGSGIALAKCKQQQLGGSITYDVQPSRVVVTIKARPSPRSTAGGAAPVNNAN